MRVELYGLVMDSPCVTFYLWSPWRAAAIEHKLFEAMVPIPGAEIEKEPDELRLHIEDEKGWKIALPAERHRASAESSAGESSA